MPTPEERQAATPNIIEHITTRSLLRRDFLAKGMVIGASVMGLDVLGTLPASAALLSTSATNPQLHIIGRNVNNGRIYHTIRFADGSWQPDFGDVNTQESNGKQVGFISVDCSGIGNNLHTTALALGGVIYHTIRFANGSWASSFGIVNPKENIPFKAVGTSGAMSGKLHLVALSSYSTLNGVLWHTIRFADGRWTRFSNVNAQESNSNLRFQNVDCASIDEDLHVVTVENDGVLWHTIHFADGSWQSGFGNVNDRESNDNLRFKSVGCASIGDNLHVIALDNDGILWHTTRFADGSWQSSFGNVNIHQSNGNLRFTDVDCANVGDNLHVTAIGTDKIIYHTIRFSSDGSWLTRFDSVNAKESNGNLRFSAVGASSTI